MSETTETQATANPMSALLAALQQHKEDPELTKRRDELKAKVAKIQAELSAAKTELASIESQLKETGRERDKAVNLLHAAALALKLDPRALGLPEPAPAPARTGGKCSNLRIKVDGAIQDGTPNRILWKYTQDCGGENDGGRLSVAQLVERAGGQETYAKGGWTVTLPNGRKLEGVIVEQ